MNKPLRCLRTLSTFQRPFNSRKKEVDDLTELGKELLGSIKVSGPLSLSHYMKSCLIHPKTGYYMKRDVFGTEGDFVTSPEISQVFGEMIAIWLVYTLQLENNISKRIRLVELGPGRGTLMSDLLRTLRQLPQIFIESVEFVEASDYLKIPQAKSIEGLISKEKVTWHSRLDDVSEGADAFTFYLAHEFMDALPIYQFKKDSDGWREIMVDAEEEDAIMNGSPHFRQVLAPNATKSLLLMQQQKEFYQDAKDGDVIQICPEAWDATYNIANRIRKHKGVGLFIDYGSLHIRDSRLRGIQNHKWVSPFSSPGLVDLSSDVEFASLQRAVAAAGAKSFGPIMQKDFLLRMGIQQRLLDLIKVSTSAAQRNDLVRSCDRLVDPNQMGSIYKFFAIGNSKPLYGFA